MPRIFLFVNPRCACYAFSSQGIFASASCREAFGTSRHGAGLNPSHAKLCNAPPPPPPPCGNPLPSLGGAANRCRGGSRLLAARTNLAVWDVLGIYHGTAWTLGPPLFLGTPPHLCFEVLFPPFPQAFTILYSENEAIRRLGGRFVRYHPRQLKPSSILFGLLEPIMHTPRAQSSH